MRSVARWLLPALVALLWLGLAGSLGPTSGKLTEVQQNDSAAFLPDSAESTRVAELLRGFETERTLPVILLWESAGGAARAAAPLAASGERSQGAAAAAGGAGALAGEAPPPIPSEDGAAVQ